ncbi:MAG: peptidoglycan-binding protein [Alphaproteobacteria bacterium]|nr:peptidoglycan-binding protein [Alphaproteobacteria bacterium]
MRFGTAIRAAAICTAAVAISVSAGAETVKDKKERKEAEIPTCSHVIGVAAVREPENKWWEGLQLGSPEALIKVFIQKSRCFRLVDRGKAFELIQQERALSSSGDLQPNSNLGKGQMLTADYIIVPDLVSKNSNASGTNIGGILGGFIGGGVGALVSNISINSKTADVVLSVANVRTGEIALTAEGHGSKTDLGFGAGGAFGTWGGFGGAAVSSYQNSDIGQIMALAYIDAYTKLVDQMGGLSDTPAADAAEQAVSMTKPGRMYEHAGGTGKVVRSLSAGMLLYPSGAKDGVWWEVSDELGNKGWVSSMLFELAK